jgi:hypothetical protein
MSGNKEEEVDTDDYCDRIALKLEFPYHLVYTVDMQSVNTTDVYGT